jgi:3-isopropylmalate dehydratase small subunit
MKHTEETVYIIGESRTNMDNAITVIYNSFYVAFEIDVDTDEIIDVGCIHTIDITERFVKKLFVGKNILDYDSLEQEIKRRYHGTSQKAVIVSYKDAIKKYQEVKNKFYM